MTEDIAKMYNVTEQRLHTERVKLCLKKYSIIPVTAYNEIELVSSPSINIRYTVGFRVMESTRL